MPREMLAHGSHARPAQPAHERAAEHGDCGRVRVEGPVADHVTAAESQVEHWREREIDAAGTQFRGHYMAGQFRPAAGVRRIVRPPLSCSTPGGISRKA